MGGCRVGRSTAAACVESVGAFALCCHLNQDAFASEMGFVKLLVHSAYMLSFPQDGGCMDACTTKHVCQENDEKVAAGLNLRSSVIIASILMSRVYGNQSYFLISATRVTHKECYC
jgi:hypothetical protein